ncbi:polysaccharide pyruvyl transferase family protein [Aurantibacter sp.]|uniref:polysaccharide pyruvyl transferase family protein n=1 Tax=Aurantibacter sp. TaxID=2807103 RepID=UPI0035C80A9D
MKAMVIGLGPEYNYEINSHEDWAKDSTKYASNHGASLISRTLIKLFNADFVNDFSKINQYQNEYDLCVIAFATHVTEKRDVSRYTKFVKDLNIKTIAFSLGIQDYSSTSNGITSLHPSLVELLSYVIKSSEFIGVRGPHTASTLLKEGFKQKNIIQIGCPTLFGPLNRNLKIVKNKSFEKPIVVYHRTMASLNEKILSNVPILGQDFLDEVIFKKEVANDQPIKQMELISYNNYKNGKLALDQISKNGIFNNTFKEWFDIIGKYDFVLGARLHGCIAALIQGIPAVMIARDIRVQEIAEFYKIPYIKYEDLGNKSIEDVYNEADFTQFNSLFKYRFDNFTKLMNDLKVLDYLTADLDVPEKYHYTIDDLNANTEILYSEIKTISEESKKLEIRSLESLRKINRLNKKFDKLLENFKKIPGVMLLKKILK